MTRINDKILCEKCFASLEENEKCPYCSDYKNTDLYPTALPGGSVLLGKYIVGKVLGKGGFGITYLCYDPKNDKRVAIKEYLPDSLTHRNTGETTVSTFNGEKEEYFLAGAQKFYEEAKLVSRFNGNPNIISVYEFFYENNTTYFVMEYLDGMDLKSYIAKNGGKLSEGQVAHIADKMCEALMIVHSMGILHRDISPDNIFVCSDGNIKLIDFGAARQVVGEASKSLSVILKQGFAPLEQYQKRGKQGPWTDIYALGASLYYALTGKIIDDAMTRISEDTLDLNGITPEFAEVLKRMLCVRIEERYQSAFELRQALSTLNIPLEDIKVEKSPVNHENEKHVYSTVSSNYTTRETAELATDNKENWQKETSKTPVIGHIHLEKKGWIKVALVASLCVVLAGIIIVVSGHRGKVSVASNAESNGESNEIVYDDVSYTLEETSKEETTTEAESQTKENNDEKTSEAKQTTTKQSAKSSTTQKTTTTKKAAGSTGITLSSYNVTLRKGELKTITVTSNGKIPLTNLRARYASRAENSSCVFARFNVDNSSAVMTVGQNGSFGSEKVEIYDIDNPGKALATVNVTATNVSFSPSVKSSVSSVKINKGETKTIKVTSNYVFDTYVVSDGDAADYDITIDLVRGLEWSIKVTCKDPTGITLYLCKDGDHNTVYDSVRFN